MCVGGAQIAHGRANCGGTTETWPLVDRFSGAPCHIARRERTLTRRTTHTPGKPCPVVDERDALLTFLAQQRLVLTIAAHGLSEEQTRATPTAGSLSVGGLIKHVAAVEEYWMAIVLQRSAPLTEGAEAAYEDGFRLLDEETLAGVIARYGQVARDTEAIVAGIDDLGRPVPVPEGVPWFPQDVDAWSVRWVLLH